MIKKATYKSFGVKIKVIKAYKYGRHSYERINNEDYRIVLDGSVRYYIKESYFYSKDYTSRTTYYCVKRIEEDEVTVLYTKRKKKGSLESNSNNVLYSSISEISAELAIDTIMDLDATQRATIKNQMQKKALEYFSDCQPIVDGIVNGHYDVPSDLRVLIKRYNSYIPHDKTKKD